MANVQLAVAGDDTTQVILSVPGVQGPTGSSIPPSGTTNQVLYKQSSTDYDTGWSLVTSAMITDGTIVNGDINASAAIAGTKISPNFGSQNVLTTGTSTAASFIPTSSGVPTNGIYLPSANNVAISTNGTGRLFVDASGRVGAGTSNPSETLTLNSAAGASLGFEYGGTEIATISNNNAALYITAASGNLLSLGAGGTERLRITSTGLVGLGTSSPAKNLHVSSSSNTALRVADTGTAPTTFGQTNGGLELVGGNANTSAKYMPGIKFGSTDSAFTTTTPKFGAAITAEASEAYDADTDGGMSLAFWTTPNDPGTGGSLQQRLTILNSGNVGVGTTSPGRNLHVAAPSGSGNATFAVERTDATTAALVIGAESNIIKISARETSASSAAGRDIQFESGPLATVRIDSSGRLLVGTSSSSAAASLILQGNSSASSTQGILYLSRGVNNPTDAQLLGVINFSDSGHAAAANIEARRDGGTWTSGVSQPTRLVFSTTADGASSPTERLRITSTGQVRLAGAGITFNGDTATANELDDYEEGVWGSISAANRRYTKIGSLVHCIFEINIPASGNAFSQTLPFALRIGTDGYTGIEVGSWFVRKQSGGFEIFPVSSQCALRCQGSTVSLVNATGSSSANTTVSELRTLFSYPSGDMAIFASFSYITDT